MIPNEIEKEERAFNEDKSLYPPFVVKELKSTREEIKIREHTGKIVPYHPTKITDFSPLIQAIWVISNAEYQERFWVRQEPPILHGDNYMETIGEFVSSTEAVLDTSDYAVKMTAKQHDMLQKLYQIIDEFEDDPNTPSDPGYGLNDSAIIADPKWHKIQAYAKLVYEEITGDDLDAWERSRAPRAKRPQVERRDATEKEIQAANKKIYPKFLLKQFKRRDKIPETSLVHYLINVYVEVWTMSSTAYQERFWVRKEFPLYDEENCMKTCGRFLCDVDTVIRGYESGKLGLTETQCESLRALTYMIEAFKKDPNKPDNPGYGINDGAIIACRQWQEVRDYAKLVYEVLAG